MERNNLPDGLIHQPKNTMPRIDEIWAVLSVDPEDGNEGLIATRMGETMYPLVAADPARVEFIRAEGMKAARLGRQDVKLVKFTVREEVEVLK